MKKITFLLLIAIVCYSCKTDVKKESLSHINGYWEIVQTISATGQKKDFKINETIDYFEIKDNKGFRKKVMPQFDGHYIVNDQKEDVEIKEEKQYFYICYMTPYGKWRDKIEEVSAEEMVLVDSSGMEYHYKRPVKFSLK
ncbi:hypothetical protein [Flavobacterium pallidum]|nr:hypothetical protein [Flavobacterium pallidum]